MDGALLLRPGETVGQDGLQSLCVLQLIVGAAGDVGLAAPDLHGEVGQQHPVTAHVDADLRPDEVPAAAAVQGVLSHPVQYLAAEGINAALHGEVDRQENHRQHGGHQGHADGHEFQPQLSDHGGHPLVENFVENVEKSVENRGKRQIFETSRQ